MPHFLVIAIEKVAFFLFNIHKHTVASGQLLTSPHTEAMSLQIATRWRWSHCVHTWNMCSG